MQFAEEDLDLILDSCGVPVQITLSGAPVKTIRGKFKKDFFVASPEDAAVGISLPSLLCKTSDLVGIGKNHRYTVGGTVYKVNSFGDPEDLPSGFTRIFLTKG